MCVEAIVSHGCCLSHSAQSLSPVEWRSPEYSHSIVVLLGEQRHAFVMGVFFLFPPYVLFGVDLHSFVCVVLSVCILCCILLSANLYCHSIAIYSGGEFFFPSVTLQKEKD